MYFPIGWPKAVNIAIPGENTHINHICCDAVKILVAAVADNFIGIWYANPLIPISFYRRTAESVQRHGCNRLLFWKPDSRSLLVLTHLGKLLLYQINFESNNSGILTQVDPPTSNLKRDSAELFIKENIPRLTIQAIGVYDVSTTITTVCCISFTEILLSTNQCQLVRLQWTQLEEAMNNQNTKGEKPICAVIDLRSIPFYVNQQCNLNCLPPIRSDAFVAALEYSPLIGGCAAVFSDRRAAFLIASHLRFETQSMHGFWVPDVEDATSCCVNHKYRLLAFGRRNSDVHLYGIEDKTGGLEFSHRLSISASVMPGILGAVNELKWSPDGCVLAVTWLNGGISLWSTFGTLLMSSLNWDFGLHVDLLHHNPLQIQRLEWSTEGYQLFMTCRAAVPSNVLLLNFVKSTLSTNPCMASHAHVLLQGDQTLYLNQGNNLETIYFGSKCTFPNNQNETNENSNPEENMEVKKTVDITSMLSESKYWTVLQLPLAYASTNWPIRYSAIDAQGLNLAVAGRTGFAHYSMLSKKWKLFGNESQEKDFVISGGLLWWKGFVVMGCFSLIDRTDEIRCYPGDCKLDNQFGNKIQVRAPVISLNMFRDQLIALTTDGIVSLFLLQKRDAYSLNVECAFELDVRNVCVHPACIVSLTVTNLRNDITSKNSNGCIATNNNGNVLAETIILNVCGRILMVQREPRSNVINSMMASCLASCVECFWLSTNTQENSPMSDCLWLYSGAQGMRVWLPILPPTSNEQLRNAPQRLHTFMSKRIMLSFPLKLYPLVILFDNVIVLGVENETILYTNEPTSHFSLPFSVLERKSQVYLHKILRQLIKRNLGYSAWEIAKSCRELPYFPHSLELLLHEVLEEEATSKEPIPDALLPSILDFIREFPVYLQTIVQCARKTEIALWPYLFSIAGKPKDLFQSCLQSEELETAASYLIILQNLEPSIISKQYATLLLDIALQNRKWELAKDLIRFLKAIDPNEIDSPRSSMIVNLKFAPPTQNHQTQVNQNSDVFNLVLGPIARERSFSTTVITNLPKEKKEKTATVAANTALANSTTAGSVVSSAAADNNISTGNSNNINSNSNNNSNNINNNNNNNNINMNNVRRRSTKERKETFCIELILQRHARTLLQKHKLLDLGYMSAFLDFHMVTWLSQETERAAKLDDFVDALTCLHEELCLPPPFAAMLTADTTSVSAADYTQLQQQFMLNNCNSKPHPSSQTSESGYFSLALMDTPTSTSNGNNIMAIKEETNAAVGEYYKSRSNSQISFENARYLQLCSLQENALSLQHDYLCNITQLKCTDLPEKLSIKIRYLLQLFVEANCTDYGLVLSILLQDAASIGRIIDVVIRSESLATCKRIEIALKRLTQWSFDRECTYRRFMLTLQPYIYLLEQYISACSNSNVVGGSACNSINLNNNRKSDISVETCDGMANERHRDSLSSLCQPGTVINLNGNWPLDKFQHERNARISRQSSFELSGFDTNMKSSSNAKNTHNDKHMRNETHSCAVM